MKKPLWEPSEERIKQANMTSFMGFVNNKNIVFRLIHALNYTTGLLKTYQISGLPCGILVESELPGDIRKWLMI